MTLWIQVALDVPLKGDFTYNSRSYPHVKVGDRVIVPFGRQTLVGIVTATDVLLDLDPSQIKEVIAVLNDLPPLDTSWLSLVKFAATYYHRSVGEVALPALPSVLRKPASYERKLADNSPIARADKRIKPYRLPVLSPIPQITLTSEQAVALEQITQTDAYRCFLLHGVTGSGKTEVYLQAARVCLMKGQQVLFLVPEINLTPQFEHILRSRLADLIDQSEIAVLHSNLSDMERVKAWADIQRQQTKLVLGTRLSIFSPLQYLGLIVVDEEHDMSYKQQEGVRYSARDLAVWRAKQLNIPIVLGSATPSLETWHHAQSGKYTTLSLTQRAVSDAMPDIYLVNTQRDSQLIAPSVLASMRATIDRGEQVLVFLNRRGYAPVLACHSCTWLSQCPNCTAYAVLHRGANYFLQCHHCGHRESVPHRCPSCGNHDLTPMGQGTQQVEAYLEDIFGSDRVLRIDADATRKKGSAQALFQKVHNREVDIVVGTQMITKGHDFQDLGLVCVLGADNALFSADFRAPEHLFSQLMQVAGRAGRHRSGAQVLIQTNYPNHPIYQYLLAQDYDACANYLLQDRQAAELPPYAYQCLITARANKLERVMAFFEGVKACFEAYATQSAWGQWVNAYDAVPLRIMRLDNVERAQLLFDSVQRLALHQAISSLEEDLIRLARQHRVQYIIDIDPQSI